MIGFGEREGEVRVNFGESKFVYDIDAHDWTVEETAAAVRARNLFAASFDLLGSTSGDSWSLRLKSSDSPQTA